MSESYLILSPNDEYYVSHSIKPIHDENGDFIKLECNVVTSPNMWDATSMKYKKIVIIKDKLNEHNITSCIVSPFKQKELYMTQSDDSMSYRRGNFNIFEYKKIKNTIDPTDYKNGRICDVRLFTTSSKLLEFMIKRIRYVNKRKLEDLDYYNHKFEKMINIKKYTQILRNIEISTLLESEENV